MNEFKQAREEYESTPIPEELDQRVQAGIRQGRSAGRAKRHGFRWGIGRALYTSPFIWIPKERCNIREGQKPKCYDKFSVEKIVYSDDGKRITALAVWNDTQKKRAFVWQDTI